MMLLWIYILGMATFPFIYMFVEYVCRGTKVFRANEIWMMIIFGFVWPIGWIVAVIIFCADDGFGKLGWRFPRLPELKIDISRWVDK